MAEEAERARQASRAAGRAQWEAELAEEDLRLRQMVQNAQGLIAEAAVQEALAPGMSDLSRFQMYIDEVQDAVDEITAELPHQQANEEHYIPLMALRRMLVNQLRRAMRVWEQSRQTLEQLHATLYLQHPGLRPADDDEDVRLYNEALLMAQQQQQEPPARSHRAAASQQSARLLQAAGADLQARLDGMRPFLQRMQDASAAALQRGDARMARALDNLHRILAAQMEEALQAHQEAYVARSGADAWQRMLRSGLAQGTMRGGGAGGIRWPARAIAGYRPARPAPGPSGGPRRPFGEGSSRGAWGPAGSF